MSRIAIISKQLSPREIVKFVSFEIIRRILWQNAKASYAQSGEDLILDSLLGHAKNGFYVDVGCNHPVSCSNTFRFYLRGWRGVAIDGNSEFAPLFAHYRPQDYFVHALVSNDASETQFKIYKDRALSSVQDKKFLQDKDKYTVERVETIRTKTLTEILLSKNVPPDFQLLSIDVEGHDFEALRSIDLSLFRPSVILIEVNGEDVDIGHIEKCEVARFLSHHNYKPVAAHGANLFFRR
jgi:FkbM family methyltransferase